MIKLRRFEKNPILLPDPNNDWESKNVFNAGATIYNNEVVLLYRAEGKKMRKGIFKADWPVTTIGLAFSKDGVNIDRKLEHPVLFPEHPYETHGCEDPRITKIGDTYYILYIGLSDRGEKLALAETKDFVTFKKLGPIFEDINQRTSAIFPEKINGRYAMIHRIEPNMWISYSDDLVHWEGIKILLRTKKDHYTEMKLGICPPPLKTDKGWLIVTHGVDFQYRYKLGIAVLDYENPEKVLCYQDEPILEPEEKWELEGFTPNVVYSNGMVEMEDKIIVYYGGADHVLGAAYLYKKELDSLF